MPSSKEVAEALTEVLTIIAYETKFEDIQGVSIESCGNYRDHSLFGAKEYAKIILAEGISEDAFERRVVK